MTERKPRRVHWTCWQPTPYNDLLFRTLAAAPAFDLTVHFREPQVTSHPWDTPLGEGYPARVAARTFGLDASLLRLAFVDSTALFVAGGWSDPTSIALLNVLMAMRRRFALWTDTPNLSTRPAIRQFARSAWLKLVFRRALAVMGTGRPALETLKVMGCKPEKLVNLPYFVDLTQYHPGIRQPESCFVFVSSGRLHGDKDNDIALRALAEAFRGRSHLFAYRIAGIGPEKDRLVALATHLGIAARVEFVGWLEPSRLPEFYRSADLLLHPARREPYGVAILEAMASGLAVIGSDTAGAVADRIIDGVNGFAYRYGDAADLTKTIVRATSGSVRLAQVRHAARHTAEEWPVTRAVDTIEGVAARGEPHA